MLFFLNTFLIIAHSMTMAVIIIIIIIIITITRKEFHSRNWWYLYTHAFLTCLSMSCIFLYLKCIKSICNDFIMLN